METALNLIGECAGKTSPNDTRAEVAQLFLQAA